MCLHTRTEDTRVSDDSDNDLVQVVFLIPARRHGRRRTPPSSTSYANIAVRG